MEKLRKALEKAKQKEEEAKKEEILTVEEPLAPKGVGIFASVAPTYTRSKSFKVDPGHLMNNRAICIDSNVPEIEFFKVLRTRILHRTKPNGWNTIMVTSALPGEGKTLTAINLALTFSREFNHTVMLVDCDLRQQAIHKIMGIPNEMSLVDALLDDVPLQDIIVWPGIEKFTIISGARTTSDASELLGSAKMQALVTEIKSRYVDRYIFFDLPPILSFSDAITFAPLVDSILFVVMAEKTSMPEIQKALELIPKEKVLGFVLNRTKKVLEETRYYTEYHSKENP